MNTVELFSGTKSFSKVMAKHGHRTVTMDNDRNLQPDYVVDLLFVDPQMIRLASRRATMLWASPPCQGFSVAAIGRNWTGGPRGYIPKSDSARLSIALAVRTIEIIEQAHPKVWFIENPRGLLRKMPFMEEFLKRTGGVRHTVTYCQYGDTRMKPTDIWTNATWWKPKPVCKNGDKCHEAAPRGSKTGTQGIVGARDRGMIPDQLFEEILKQIPVHKKVA